MQLLNTTHPMKKKLKVLGLLTCLILVTTFYISCTNEDVNNNTNNHQSHLHQLDLMDLEC